MRGPTIMAFGDRPADGLGHGVLGAEIAYGGEARHQGPFRVRYRPQCRVRGFQGEVLDEPVGTLLARDMHVHVDPAGHDERTGQVDVRLAHITRFHGRDAIAVHDDGCGFNHFAGGSVDQFAGVNDRLRPGADGQEQRQYQDRDSHDISFFVCGQTGYWLTVALPKR